MIEMIPRIQISGRVWKFIILSTICTVATSVSAKQPPGFIGIDCGSATQYQDSLTNLTWETDGNYIRAGKNGVVANSPNSTVDNYEALRTFKYFVEPQSKYCYELPLATGNISILIRAMFLHGNSSELVLPTTFNVYVNATLWNSVYYGSGESLDVLNSPHTIEGIFYSPGNVSYVCLVPDQGVPFISSLELRQLDPEGVMYSLGNSNRQSQFLSNFIRYNLGAFNNLTVRYPDDAYDRLWINPGPYLNSGISSQKENANTSSKWNNVPPKVMMNALFIPSDEYESNPLTVPLRTASSSVHAIFYSQAFNNSEGLKMIISLNDETSAPFGVTNIPVMTTLDFGLFTNSVIIAFSSPPSSGGMVNAMEIYEKVLFDHSATYPGDVLLLGFLTTTFNLSYVQGDPCCPVPYDAITCSDVNRYGDDELSTSLQGIESLNLSKLEDSVSLQNAGFFLQRGTLEALRSLSITDCHIDDATFQFLIENFTANSPPMDSLDLSYNDITTFPSLASWSTETWWGPRMLFDNIDLSHNSFSGEVLSFTTFNTPAGQTSLTKLNLSYNSFTSFPNFWGNSSQGLLNMTLLDLSHNYISSDISLLNDLLRKNPSFEEIHLSDNLLRGVFPSDLYFSEQKLPNLRLVNISRNNITGLLNLTAWYELFQDEENYLKRYPQSEQAAVNVFNSTLGGRLYSFVDNDISEIIPSAESFQPMVEFLMRNFSLFNESGVLLWGNPYCKGAKSLTQRYLCRSNIDDIIYDNHTKKRNAILVSLTTLGGIVLLLLSSIMFIVIWKLWRQLSITSKLLREVQQELTNRKVQPPFYSYHDLRVATRGFHEDYKLGSGAYGVVYKGILSDGSTVAVKRLFNSDKAQVLNDFLSEVALISGIKHKHLIQLKGCCIKNEERILIYEFARNGDLAEALWGEHRGPILDWVHRLNIAVGVARGLSYLHEELQPRIIHRDIKAVNVLLDDNLNAKIADFGLAKSFGEEETQAQFTAIAGTRGYFAPEYVLEGQLTVKVDVFSFGILLLEIVAGRKCIDHTLPSNRFYIKNWAEDLKTSGTLLELLQPGLRGTAPEAEFIKIINVALSCIETNPKLRPTMSQVVIMLLGNLDVQISQNEDESTREGADFRFGHFKKGPRMPSGMKYEHREIIDGESEEVPFLRSNTFPVSMPGRSGADNSPTLELSSVKGR